MIDKSSPLLSGNRPHWDEDTWESNLHIAKPALNWQKLEWWADVESAVRNLTTDEGISLKDVL